MVGRLVCALLVCLWMALPGQVRAQDEDVDARLMILHDHGNPVLSEMIVLTLRGEYDLTVSLEEMIFPNSPEYDWMQIARDDWHKERIDGRLLQIFERKIALFPRHDGPVSVGPVTHRLTYVPDGGGRRQTDVTAPPIRLNVKPFPGGHRPLSASQLTLTDELSAQPGQLRKDEVLVRRVTIEALGTLAHQLPPRPDLTEPWLISFTKPELRETRLTEAGPVARVVWEWQLRPMTGEPATLHAQAFPWFDTETRQIEVVAMKPIPFGFAGFGSNFGASPETVTRNRLVGLGLVMAGGLVALAVMLRGQGLVPLAGARRRLRRLMPGPQAGAMRRAARLGDLAGLRRAVDMHLNWLGQRGQTDLMAALDDQLYAADPPPGFDARGWLVQFRRALRHRAAGVTDRT